MSAAKGHPAHSPHLIVFSHNLTGEAAGQGNGGRWLF